MVKILKKTTFEDFFAVNEEVAKTSPMRTHYHSTNPFERWLWDQKRQIIKGILSQLQGENIIDLGCGDGELIDIIDDNVDYTGVDISPTQVQSAKEHIKQLGKEHAVVIKNDILELPFAHDTFDCALACDVVEHVLSPERLFREAKRVVKKNGYIIFSIPNEILWEAARALLLKFPVRSPDHINAVYPRDIQKHFSQVIKEVHLPFRFSASISLINIFLVKNVK